jgi:hypothetical protein
MQGRFRRVLSAVAACALTACGAASTPAPQHAARCSAAADARTRREMTWAEYYTDVAQRARRNRATIIWVNPPGVRVAANACK